MTKSNPITRILLIFLFTILCGCSEELPIPTAYSECPPAYEKAIAEWEVLCQKPWSGMGDYYDGEEMKDDLVDLLWGSVISDSCSGRAIIAEEVNNWCEIAKIQKNKTQ